MDEKVNEETAYWGLDSMENGLESILLGRETASDGRYTRTFAGVEIPTIGCMLITSVFLPGCPAPVHETVTFLSDCRIKLVSGGLGRLVRGNAPMPDLTAPREYGYPPSQMGLGSRAVRPVRVELP